MVLSQNRDEGSNNSRPVAKSSQLQWSLNMKRHYLAGLLSVGVTLSAIAGTFETIKDPSCISSPEFSTGEQYNDSNNGILYDQWFMLARWQANEPDFVSNSVSYDVGTFTALHSAPYQRGVAPENSNGTSAVQLSCYDGGMLINSWSTPPRPVVGGGYNDMI